LYGSFYLPRKEIYRMAAKTTTCSKMMTSKAMPKSMAKESAKMMAKENMMKATKKK
jgi:hypothetical protein